MICPRCRGRKHRSASSGAYECLNQIVVGMVPYRPFGPPEIPVFNPCGYNFTAAESEVTERVDAEKAKRAAEEGKQRREEARAEAETAEVKRIAEAPRLEALRREAEAAARQREVHERQIWVVLWVGVTVASSAGAFYVLLLAGGSLALLGASLAALGFALFRLAIVGFDPPVKAWEDLYVTLVWGLLGLAAGFLVHVSGLVGS